MHINLLSQRRDSDTEVVAGTLNLCSIVEALATSGYGEKWWRTWPKYKVKRT